MAQEHVTGPGMGNFVISVDDDVLGDSCQDKWLPWLRKTPKRGQTADIGELGGLVKNGGVWVANQQLRRKQKVPGVDMEDGGRDLVVLGFWRLIVGSGIVISCRELKVGVQAGWCK